jgi:hypothetical protein
MLLDQERVKIVEELQVSEEMVKDNRLVEQDTSSIVLQREAIILGKHNNHKVIMTKLLSFTQC